jgi:hypothetical protein
LGRDTDSVGIAVRRWGGCPSCGEPVIAGHQFCHACGHVLAESPSASPMAMSASPGAAPAADPVAEGRVCSVLFCDVVGFTAAAIGEAAVIAERLGCQPLPDRAEAIQPVRPRTAAS